MNTAEQFFFGIVFAVRKAFQYFNIPLFKKKPHFYEFSHSGKLVQKQAEKQRISFAFSQILGYNETHISITY